jgi:hypothetical protein
MITDLGKQVLEPPVSKNIPSIKIKP